MNRFAVLFLFAVSTVVASDHQLKPVRIAVPVDGHIHPAACVTHSGTIVVTYGRVNHVDLRVTRSSDGGMTWSESIPFVHTVDKTYYPGSLTTLSDGRLVHCWNRWDTPVTQKEPRSVLYSLSSDEGVRGSDPQPFPRDPEVRSVTRHPVTELASGKWLVSLIDRTWVFDPVTSKATPFGDGRDHGLIPIVQTPRGTFVSGAGLRSTDNGQTWKTIDGFPDISTQGWRHEMVVLKNGLAAGLGDSRTRIWRGGASAIASHTTTGRPGTACSSTTTRAGPSTAGPVPEPCNSTTRRSEWSFTTSTRIRREDRVCSSCESRLRSWPYISRSERTGQLPSFSQWGFAGRAKEIWKSKGDTA